MADWVNIPDAALEPDKPILSTTNIALRDNPKRIAEGAPGAPRIQTDALDTGVVTEAKIATDAVTASKIETGAVQAGKIDSEAVSNAKIMKNTAEGTTTLSSLATSVIPRSVIYYLPHADIEVQVFVGGGWVTAPYGLVISDGASFRLLNNAGASRTIRFRELF